MNVPLILRFGLAWAILTKNFVRISFGASRDDGPGGYRFDVDSTAVKGWIKRRERKKDMINRVRDEERAAIVAKLRQIHSTAILDPDGALEAIGAELDKLDPPPFEAQEGLL